MSERKKRNVDKGDGDGPMKKRSRPAAGTAADTAEEEEENEEEMDGQESSNLSLSPDFSLSQRTREVS